MTTIRHWMTSPRASLLRAFAPYLAIAFGYSALLVLLWGACSPASAQPYFRETDGGVTTWDSGRPWPNPDGEDRLRHYPVGRP